MKISTDAHELLKELAVHAAKHGWSAFGIDREDPPTQMALLEAGIDLLDAARKKRRKR